MNKTEKLIRDVESLVEESKRVVEEVTTYMRNLSPAEHDALVNRWGAQSLALTMDRFGAPYDFEALLRVLRDEPFPKGSILDPGE